MRNKYFVIVQIRRLSCHDKHTTHLDKTIQILCRQHKTILVVWTKKQQLLTKHTLMQINNAWKSSSKTNRNLAWCARSILTLCPNFNFIKNGNYNYIGAYNTNSNSWNKMIRQWNAWFSNNLNYCYVCFLTHVTK